MTPENRKQERTLTVADLQTMSTRSAASFVKAAMRFNCSITVATPGSSCNGKSLMSLLFLGARLGNTLTISAQGADADLALDTLETLLRNRFQSSSEHCASGSFVAA